MDAVFDRRDFDDTDRRSDHAFAARFGAARNPTRARSVGGAGTGVVTMVRRCPSHTFADISDEIVERVRGIAKRLHATGGVFLLVPGIIGFIWLFPEIRRYLRIERM